MRAAPGSEQAARSGEQPWAPGGGGAGLFAEIGLDVGSQPGPGALECLGVGLVRAVDAVARRVYLLTPLAPQELQRVSVLLVRSEYVKLTVALPSVLTPHSNISCVGLPGAPNTCGNFDIGN